MKPRPYRLLARFYDQLAPYALGMNRYARRKILGRILSRVRSVCELGCGTGDTALDLARRGLTVYAVDYSPTMCRLTHEKARRARLPVRVIRSDMRSFRLPELVDLVLCEFSSLNHVAPRNLAPVFGRVARALRPGGYFSFDVNTVKSFEELPQMKEKMEAPRFVVFMTGDLDRRRRRARLNLDWFVRAGRAWRRHREHVDHTWWTDAEIRRALRRAGFGRVRVWDGPQVRPPGLKARPGFDTYYLARKRAG